MKQLALTIVINLCALVWNYFLLLAIINMVTSGHPYIAFFLICALVNPKAPITKIYNVKGVNLEGEFIYEEEEK